MARITHRTSNATPHRVLVIDDDPRYIRSLTRLLGVAGVDAQGETDIEAAIALVPQWRPELVLVDYFMPVMTGDAVIARIRTFDTSIPCLVISGYAGGRGADLFSNPDVQALHSKAESPTQILACVDLWAKASRAMRALHTEPGARRPVLDLLTTLLRRPHADQLPYALARMAVTAGAGDDAAAIAVSVDGLVLGATGAYTGARSLGVTDTVGLLDDEPDAPVAYRRGHLVVRWGGGAAVLRCDEPAADALEALRSYPIVFEALQAASTLSDRRFDSWGP